MVCSAPTGLTQGLLVAYDLTDTGVRPLAGAYWISPNIRLAAQADVAALRNPANWDTPQFANWTGQVNVSTAYQLLVRVRNTDPELQRASLNLQGWVSDYTVGGVGPESAISVDPAQPAGSTNPPVQFSGFNEGPIAVANTANSDDPASMLVLVSNESWAPNANQQQVNGGHVCLGVNVYAEATNDGTPTPADGQELVAGFLDPTCDRMYGQRNIQIVTVMAGRDTTVPVKVKGQTGNRFPQIAVITVHQVDLTRRGGLKTIPELTRLASDLGLGQLRQPEGDLRETLRFDDVAVASWKPTGLPVTLKQGERRDFTLTLDARNRRPGDVFALDIVTTLTTGGVYGAARVLALVTK
jgi:hypothetical protein